MPAALVQLVEHVCAQLVRSVVGAALRLLEANISGRHGEDGVPVRLRDGDVRVVLVRVDVEVEWLMRRTPVLSLRLGVAENGVLVHRPRDGVCRQDSTYVGHAPRVRRGSAWSSRGRSRPQVCA